MRIEVEKGISSIKETECAMIPALDWTIQDIKFIDDTELVMATRDECAPPAQSKPS